MYNRSHIYPRFGNYYRSYFCPECFNKVDIDTQDKCSHLGVHVNSTSKNIAIARANIEFDVICCECDGFMIQCDSDIIDRIIKLNNLGIETMYCCEGHINTIEKPFTFTKQFQDDYNYHINLPYIGFSIEISENIMDYIDKLLSFQEYGFIEFEATEYMYVLRGKFDSDKYDKHYEMEADFELMRNNFLRFIDEIINILEYYKNTNGVE